MWHRPRKPKKARKFNTFASLVTFNTVKQAILFRILLTQNISKELQQNILDEYNTFVDSHNNGVEL